MALVATVVALGLATVGAVASLMGGLAACCFFMLVDSSEDIEVPWKDATANVEQEFPVSEYMLRSKDQGSARGHVSAWTTNLSDAQGRQGLRP